MCLLFTFLPDEDTLKPERVELSRGMDLAVYGLKIITERQREGEILQFTKHFNTALLRN